MDLSDKVKNLYYNSFNPQLAFISAVANGVFAAGVNYEQGSLEILAASATQAAASFISTGFTARLVQHYSPLENKFDSYFYGSLVPATATFVISYAGHTLNETSQLLGSCIIPTLFSLFSSPITNFLTKKGYFRPKNYPSDNTG